MPRNTKYEAFKTRMHLLDVAINEFSIRGYTATTLMDIAESAGVTRGAIYWHFANKTELFNEIWMRERPIYEQINQDIYTHPGNSPLYILKMSFTNGLKLVASDPKQRNLMNIVFHKCEFGDSMLSGQDIRQRLYINPQRLASLLNECKHQKQLPASINIEHSVNVICAYFTGIIGNWLAYQNVFNLYRDAEQIVSQLIYMLSYRESESMESVLLGMGEMNKAPAQSGGAQERC